MSDPDVLNRLALARALGGGAFPSDRPAPHWATGGPTPQRSIFHRAGDTLSNPVSKAWAALPPNARQAYASLAALVGELSPGAAARDMVQESGNMTKAALSGDVWGSLAGGAGMLAAGVGAVPGSRLPGVVAKATTPGFRAYHGSPHDFDKFSSSKIGTGEGAQSYGHGLYFAENEGVARNYRDKLAAKLLSRGKTDAPLATGRMYEVNINADPARFLDWDKPLRDQSPAVNAALGMFGGPDDIRAAMAMYEPRLKLPDIRADMAREELAKLRRQLSLAEAKTGGAFYESSNIVPGPYRDPKAASNALRDAGIPGIKYLDGGSRSAGQGSSNYVVFDDSLIEILRKYGLLPLAAGGAAATMLPEDGREY